MKYIFPQKIHPLSFSDALFYPDITSPEYLLKPTTFQITIPKLTLTGVDIPSAYYSSNINVKEILASRPKVEIYSQKGKTKPLDFKELTIPLPSEVNALKVDKVHLDNGEVVTYRIQDNSHTQTSSFTLDLITEGITLSQLEELNAKNISARLTNFQLILDGKSHEIKVDELLYDKEPKTIDIRNLRVNPSKWGTPDNQFSFQVPSIKFRGFETDLAYQENIYQFSLIDVDAPSIKINLKDTLKSGGLEKLRELDFYPYLEAYLDQLNIGTLSLNNANIDFQAIAKGLKHEDINIALKNIKIGKNQPPNRLLNSEYIELKTYNIQRNSKNNWYSFLIDTFLYSSANNSLELLNIHINPRYSKVDLARLAGNQTDILNSEIESIKLSDVDIDKWLAEKSIEAGLLQIGSSTTTIFRNKRYPFNDKQVPPLPQEMLSSIPYPFTVDSVIMHPAMVTYSELLDISDEPATISFNNLNASLGRVSNIPAIVNKNPLISIKANALINDAGELNAVINFDLSDNKHHHTVTGSLQPMPMNAFNNFTEKAAFVTVEEGQMNRFNFELELDNQLATGLLWFGYDNLKVAVIDFEDGLIKKEGFASLMANSLLVNSKNPKGKELIPENIAYTRDSQRSILNYWWKAIFSGTKKSLGIKEKKK